MTVLITIIYINSTHIVCHLFAIIIKRLYTDDMYSSISFAYADKNNKNLCPIIQALSLIAFQKNIISEQEFTRCYNTNLYLYNQMLQPNINKYQNTDIKLYSSHHGSSAQIQTSLKKKPFSRKPSQDHSITSEKRKRVLPHVATTKNLVVEQIIKQKSIPEPQYNIVSINRKERQTENFYKDKELVKEFAHNYSKEALNSPLSQKNSTEGPVQFSSHSKKDTNIYNFDQESIRKAKAIKFYRYAGQRKERDENESDSAFDKSSTQSFKNIRSISNHSNADNACSYKNLMNHDSKYRLERSRGFQEDNTLVAQCFYCKNNKRIVDILTEKQHKLEQQYQAKMTIIKQCTDECQHLKKDNTALLHRIQQSQKAVQSKQSFYLRDKQQLLAEIQKLSSEVSTLKDRIRYDQIQVNMLLRYKDEYQLLTRQFDHIKRDNEQLKRQIANLQNQNRFVFTKPKPSPAIAQLKAQSQKKYQFYSKMMVNTEKDRYFREDDDISLTLSERSTDQS